MTALIYEMYSVHCVLLGLHIIPTGYDTHNFDSKDHFTFLNFCLKAAILSLTPKPAQSFLSQALLDFD